MKLYIAGGVGEHGRNCFMIEDARKTYLIDCGLMAEEGEKGVPRLSQARINRVRGVFLTHSHADHTGALPWLLKTGYHGPVYAARETLSQLPFSLENGVALDSFCDGQTGRTDGLTVRWGRSGHCVGSMWYEIATDEQTFFFSGDYTENTQVYAYDPIRGRHADFAVLDCAYGRDEISYARYCQELLDVINHCRSVVFPVPKYGRGLEVLKLFHDHFPQLRFAGDAHFREQVAAISCQSAWFKPEAGTLKDISVADPDDAYDVLFISDPQLRSLPARSMMDRALAAGNRAVMTGTVERGTYSWELVQNGQMEVLRYPVHLNLNQYDYLVKANTFASSIGYHCAEIG